MASVWTYNYVALYNKDNILVGMILYKENGDGDINKYIDVYAPKEHISNLIEGIKTKALPFEPMSSLYFEERLVDSLINVVKNDYTIINGMLETNIENMSMARKQIIKQENKYLIRKRVNIYG